MPIFTYNLKQTDIMKDLLKFATEGNADQVFAILDDQHFENPILMGFKNRYEQGDLGDSGLCDEVLKYLNATFNYVGIMVEREDWDNPTFNSSIEARNEEQAYEIFAESIGHTVDSLEEGELSGEIKIIIKKV